MNSYKQLRKIAGWSVFAIALVVFYFSAERVGSLWDCGEFITGALKLQVVHPPGAAIFLLIGRVFTFLAQTFSDNPENISFAVNMLSGICTAFTAMFICWVTIILGRMALVGRDGEPDTSQSIALAGAGVVAGLSTAFCTSIWFSAVEGEVYAMSTFFTALTLWAVIKWYELPDTKKADRWLLFAVYSAGLSIGVHLLSILTFPALALLYYFKKYKEHTLIGMGLAAAAGVGIIVFIQKIVIVGIPTLWSQLELLMVNSFGLPFHSGIFPLVLIIAGIFAFGLRLAHTRNSALIQNLVIGAFLIVIGFSTIGVVVIRANANTPINMNNPSDPMRLIPYLNREQYGERALVRGPYYDAKPVDSKVTKRYGQVKRKLANGKTKDVYEIVDHKVSYVYNNRDKMLFPRLGDYSQGRPALYKRWIDRKSGKPSFGDNISFLFNYQLGWMYWRYFMWNFAGRQNGDQGFYSWDVSSGHWLSGIGPYDSARLYNQTEMPESMLKHKARNKYYMLPFLFGLLGLFFHLKSRPKDFIGLLTLFIITGIGIIIYSNQPPNEPRERDYVLVGSFFTYCIWIGMGVLALFQLLRERLNFGSNIAAPLASVVVLSAPLIMGFQNFDDHSRMHHTGARDYASNFLESCDPNAIIFTYGDNDTYPLWYAQEVEGIRTDVRVVNLSLIAVDWYIDQLRRKVNDSPPLKMTIGAEAIRGFKRNQIPFYNPGGKDPGEIALKDALRFIGEDHPLAYGANRKLESYLPSQNLYIPVNKQKLISTGEISPTDSLVVDKMRFKIKNTQLLKGDVGVLDIIASNIWERPIYFAVTCRQESLLGLDDYMQLEGLSLKIVPYKSKGDPQYGMMGNGRVNTDKVYKNIMEKYRWGNFDKHELYVDRSYGPSVQSHRVAIMRTTLEMVKKGDNQKAIDLVEKYFEGFPHMNFPYDYNAYYMIRILIQAGAYEKAKKHMKILADETADHLNFYYSLDPDDLESGFQQDFALAMRTQQDLISAAKQAKDTAFEKELTELFKPYALKN